jgi:hypothetical protein
MTALAYHGSQGTKLYAVRWTYRSFTSFYFESYIWPYAISRWIRQTNSIKFCADLKINSTKTLAMIRWAFVEESMCHTQSPDSPRLIEFFLAGQAVNFACYCDILWRPHTLLTKELAVASWQRSFARFPFHQGIFDRTVIPHPPYFSLFSRLKIKLKVHHFDTIEVIEAESQAVLNTTSRMHLRNGRSSGKGAYTRKGTASRAMVPSRPEVSFRPDGSTTRW